jgi:hypothetical protein
MGLTQYAGALLGSRSRRSTFATLLDRSRVHRWAPYVCETMRCCHFRHRTLWERISTRPQGRRRVRLHQPCSRRTLTVFDVRGYVTETIFVTTLLLDRSWTTQRMTRSWGWNHTRTSWNSLVGNETELGIVIPTIMSRTSADIKWTKGIRLNAMVQTTIVSLWNAEKSPWLSRPH